MKGQLLPFGRGQSRGNQINDPVQLALMVQERGGEGYRIEGNQLIVLRWDHDGNEVIVDRFEMVSV